MGALVSYNHSRPIYLCAQATSMALGIPGLSKKISEDLGSAPEEDALYVFVSRNFKRMKILYWDRNGFAVWYKSISKGAFRVEWNKKGYREITGIDVRVLSSGAGRRVV